MGRFPKNFCGSCETTRIEAGAPFCGGCGRPTPWATHQDRIDWEVVQWRKARSGAPAEGGTIAALPRNPARATERREEFLTSSDPKPAAARAPRRPSAVVAFLRRALAALRRTFGTSMVVPLGGRPGLPAAGSAPNPIGLSAAGSDPEPSKTEPPRMMLVRAAPPEVPAADASPAVREASASSAPASTANGDSASSKAPPKPRKRPTAPTNKDLLKKTLSVLTKVEKRLEQLEQEVAGIEGAVRKPASGPEDNGLATALGE